jgi:hypothetical protein
LTPCYTDSLGWLLPLSRSGVSFRAGVQHLGGVDFDVRGGIRLFGKAAQEAGITNSPLLTAISVMRKARTLHLLHCAQSAKQDPIEVAKALVHYVDGRSATIPLVTEVQVASDWFSKPDPPKQADVVWVGTSPAAEAAGQAIRLTRFAWRNPHPETEISTLDLASANSHPNYVLLAVTME